MCELYSYEYTQVIFGGTRAAKRSRYSFTLPSFEERVAQSIRWLKEDQMALVVIYHDNPNWAGHDEGPDDLSARFFSELRTTDQYIGAHLLFEI